VLKVDRVGGGRFAIRDGVGEAGRVGSGEVGDASKEQGSQVDHWGHKRRKNKM